MSNKSKENFFKSKLGLEIELTYSPSREEFHRLKAHYCDTIGVCPPSLDHLTFFRLLMEEAKGKFSDLFYRNPLADGGGVEFVLAPFSYSQFICKKRRFKALLDFAKSFYLYPSVKDGIHVNIDYSLLGDGITERIETLRKLLLFVSPLSDAYAYVQHFCAREHEASNLSDVYTMLNDPFRKLGSLELEKAFKETQSSILDALGSGASMCALNMCFGKEGRDCIEWRWFASTTDLKRLYNILDFVYSIIIFARTHKLDEMNLARYKRYRLWYRINRVLSHLGW